MPRSVRSPDVTRVPWWTTGAIARLLSVAPRTVSGWIDRGELEGVRLPPSQVGKHRGGNGQPNDAGDRRVYADALIRFCKQHGFKVPLTLGPLALLCSPDESLLAHLGRSLAQDCLLEVASTGFGAGRVVGAAGRWPDVLLLDGDLGAGTCREILAQVRGIHHQADRPALVLLVSEDASTPPAEGVRLRRPCAALEVESALRTLLRT